MGRPAKSQPKAQNASSNLEVNKGSHRQQKASKRCTKINPPARMTTYTRPPQTWPAGLPYLSTVHLHASLTAPQRDLVRPADVLEPSFYTVSSQCKFSPVSNPLIAIELIKFASHPAYPQSGLFAARQLASGTHILDYTGLLHSCPLPTCENSDYDLAFLDRDASVAIDGASMGNEARFINDYHGIRDNPNAVFEEYYAKVKGLKGREIWEARMGVWVSPLCNSIAKGEEICLSYGKGYWRARMGAMEQQNETVEDAVTETEDDLQHKMKTTTMRDEKK